MDQIGSGDKTREPKPATVLDFRDGDGDVDENRFAGEDFDSACSPPFSEVSDSGGSGSMSSADELFLNGKIRPMKLSSHLQRAQALTPLLDLEESLSPTENPTRLRSLPDFVSATLREQQQLRIAFRMNTPRGRGTNTLGGRGSITFRGRGPGRGSGIGRGSRKW